MSQHEHDEPTSVGATIGAVVGVLIAVLIGALIVFLVFGAGIFDDDSATPTLEDGEDTEAGAGDAGSIGDGSSSYRPLPLPPLVLDRDLATPPRALSRMPRSCRPDRPQPRPRHRHSYDAGDAGRGTPDKGTP